MRMLVAVIFDTDDIELEEGEEDPSDMTAQEIKDELWNDMEGEGTGVVEVRIWKTNAYAVIDMLPRGEA